MFNLMESGLYFSRHNLINIAWQNAMQSGNIFLLSYKSSKDV